MAGFVSFLSGIIETLGYGGIFAAVALEYACFPVSSEILLPFIGYSVYLGELSLFKAIFSSTLGGGVGCSVCYFAGRFGRGILERIFKEGGAVSMGICKAEDCFNSMGKQSVFFGRLMPIVRTYISFPAGMAKMKYSKFLIFSISGALLWNTVLISLGFFLGEHWESVAGFFKANNMVITGSVVVLTAAVFAKKMRKKKACK